MNRLSSVPPDTKVYTYHPGGTLPYTRWVNHLVGLIFLTLSTIIVGFGAISQILRVIEEFPHIGALGNIPVFVIMASPPCLIPLFHFMVISNIALTPDGIRLDVVGPWQDRISWQSMQSATIIKRTTKSIQLRQLEGKEVYLVHTADLPRIYVLVGLAHGLGFTAVFAVTSHHERYEELIEKLEQMAP